MLAALLAAGCAGWQAPWSAPAPAPHAWEPKLSGNRIVLLGEVHDNAAQHRDRLAVLQRAVAAGWRPVIAMEQFDRERQPDIERARQERPRDADHLIAAAAPGRSGWDWAHSRPFVAFALAHDLPIVAANLSTADAMKVVREGTESVFGVEERRTLALDRPVPADWQAAQEREIAAGHCGALPAARLPAMARAQFARDAVMADVLRRHGSHGIVLLAGNGHVRRDFGAPRWLDPDGQARAWAVGYLEAPVADAARRPYDEVVVTPAAEREDPCAAFTRRDPTSRPPP